MTGKHPSINESLILVCSAMVFAVENWDKYLEMIDATEESDKVGNDEVKEMMMHLIDDTRTQIEAHDLLMAAMASAAKIMMTGKV